MFKQLKVVGLALSGAAALVVSAQEKIGFKYESNHADALYRLGEEAVITVTVTNGTGAKVTSGRVTARLDNYGSKIIEKRDVDLAQTNPFVMKGTLNEPGFIRLTMGGTTNVSRGCRMRWGVGFEPTKIRPAGPCPDDFDAFWKAAREKFAKEVPLDPRLELVPERSKGKFDFYRISFAAPRNTRVWGFLSVPKDKSKAPYPALFEAPSAGEGRWVMDTDGRADCIKLYMTIHEFEPPRKFEDVPACFKKLGETLAARGQVNSYSAAGLDGKPEDYYFYRAVLGLDRAIDWLWAREDVDRRHFSYQGGSQGGFFGWMLCGLNHKFTSAVLRVPAGSDTRGYRKGREACWPSPTWRYPKEKRTLVERNMGYFDGASFAPRITCPICVTVGFTDNTCPPPCVYATYNVLGSKDKRILNAIGCGHGGETREYEAIATRWMVDGWKK